MRSICSTYLNALKLFVNNGIKKELLIYIKTGCWEIMLAKKMLLISKLFKKGKPAELRIVVDLYTQNKNMRKMASSLSDQQGTFNWMAQANFIS